MRYFIDTEFHEKPGTLELISIGIVAEDGRELYRASSDFKLSGGNSWVEENVLPYLPAPESRVSVARIAEEVLRFVDPDPEFWGYYADYDWILFCWLFGPMVDLPDHFPRYCLDIKQFCKSLGNPRLPENPATHVAIEDARWIREVHGWLTAYARGKELLRAEVKTPSADPRAPDCPPGSPNDP